MKILEKQEWHFLSLLAFVIIAYCILKSDEIMLRGSFWSLSTAAWIVISLLCAIVHQIYIAVFWRLELHSKWLTKKLGNNAFPLFKVGFLALIISRPISVTALAISNQNTFELNPIWAAILTIIILLPLTYLVFSILKYFGIDRAVGLDHFDQNVAKEGLVKKGIFKYLNNAMYVFGFLTLYIPAILLASKAALFAAVWSHLYIWIHYFFTEKPDFKYIYKK